MMAATVTPVYVRTIASSLGASTNADEQGLCFALASMPLPLGWTSITAEDGTASFIAPSSDTPQSDHPLLVNAALALEQLRASPSAANAKLLGPFEDLDSPGTEYYYLDVESGDRVAESECPPGAIIPPLADGLRQLILTGQGLPPTAEEAEARADEETEASGAAEPDADAGADAGVAAGPGSVLGSGYASLAASQKGGVTSAAVSRTASQIGGTEPAGGLGSGYASLAASQKGGVTSAAVSRTASQIGDAEPAGSGYASLAASQKGGVTSAAVSRTASQSGGAEPAGRLGSGYAPLSGSQKGGAASAVGDATAGSFTAAGGSQQSSRPVSRTASAVAGGGGVARASSGTGDGAGGSLRAETSQGAASASAATSDTMGGYTTGAATAAHSEYGAMPGMTTAAQSEYGGGTAAPSDYDMETDQRTAAEAIAAYRTSGSRGGSLVLPPPVGAEAEAPARQVSYVDARSPTEHATDSVGDGDVGGGADGSDGDGAGAEPSRAVSRAASARSLAGMSAIAASAAAGGLGSRAPVPPPSGRLTFFGWWFEDVESADLTFRIDSNSQAGGGLAARHCSLVYDFRSSSYTFSMRDPVTPAAPGQATDRIPELTMRGLTVDQVTLMETGRAAEVWDLHVGARLRVLGRPVALKNAELATSDWHSGYCKQLAIMRDALATEIQKYKPRALRPGLVSDKGAVRQLAGQQLRHMAAQVRELIEDLRKYRPSRAESYMAKLPIVF